MTYRQVVSILERHGFVFERHGKGSHRVYQAHHSGQRWSVTLSYSQLGEDVKPGTLGSIIRQSGLPRDAFRR
ncbi:MAG: type II toxin-antitoxin system HicA family toxin [Chloroflexota bacterium]|nr:type II toxin-antitoxin system HicA family toxin [Chloroflexota bacterium]MDE2961676.1 type II toxin-antitoxin system HicA family toxin [Chloroflexota bacterium]